MGSFAEVLVMYYKWWWILAAFGTFRGRIPEGGQCGDYVRKLSEWSAGAALSTEPLSLLLLPPIT